MKLPALLQSGYYSSEWVKDFYDQAGIWWGSASDMPAEDQARAASIERLCGTGAKRVLELGAGAGHTAAAIADRGHAVIAVEFSPQRCRHAQELVKTPRPGSLTFIAADFYTVALAGRFDVVCYWDGFGIGSDADQRRLLTRIAREWLASGGCALMDVANPVWAIRHAGEERRLAPLASVPGSVEMCRRYHFDPVHGRWIDEWQPVADPSQARAQTVRCYTPADFRLLLEGTGLVLRRIEVDGAEIDFASGKIETAGALQGAYSYLAQVKLRAP